MVHRSGSTHQYDELFTNEESNPKAKDDLQISETLKNSTNANTNSSDVEGNDGGSSSSSCQKATAIQLDENETKRQLRTSKRLCSINPDVMIPPKSIETTITSTTSSNSSSNISSCSTSNNSSKTSTTDPLITAFTAANLIPIATIKPKSIGRNRRYTINDCVHRPSEKSSCSSSSSSNNSSIVVPFADQKSKQLLKISSTTDELYIATKSTSKPRASGKSLDDFNIQKDHFNCSVSLERLTGIAESISMKLPFSLSDKDDLTAAAANKVLCLYCDRTFSSLKLYAKHVERVHQSKSGRRISARTIVSNATATNYPGCSYCNVGKVTCLETEELTQLVRHLIQQHGDKYFACEDCLIRFQTREQLQKHASILHGHNDAKAKKESQQKQRKTSRNNNVQSSSSSSISSISSSSSSSLMSSLGAGTSAAAVTPLTVQVDFDSVDTSDQTNLRNRLRRSTDLKAKSDRSTRKHLLTSEETFLSRLGIGLNRSPRSRKGAKNRRGCSSELFETTRSTRSNKNAKPPILSNYDAGESVTKQISSKTEPIGYAFDEDFYESVCQNVKMNLSCHLDGKLDGPMSPSPLSPVASIPTVRSILVKSPLVTETEIHEATTISAFTAFPTLLTAQQHGGESLTPGKIKKPITKHSWKWKWDCVKKYKYVNEGGKIVKKIKQSTCGMRDLSTLDMWTQLTMRMRHEVATRQENENTGEDNVMGIGEAARAEKRKLIDQLNKILDTRILPKINVEQNDQSIIKQETVDDLRSVGDRTAMSTIALPMTSSNSMLQRPATVATGHQRDPEFPALMDLIKRERSDATETPVILSGEWARPRCYICFGCGSLFSTVRLLEEHKAVKHPFVHSTHYEIVGKELIDGNLFRNFYIPSVALQRHTEYNKKQFYNSICSADDSMDSMTSTSMSLTKSDSFDLDSNSRNSKVSVSSVASISDRSYSASADDENANSSSERMLAIDKVCTKCNRQCKGTLDLYRHMLDCSSDYAWILAKKRNNIKYRYFGTKRRRPQRSRSTSGRKVARPKKERRNSDTCASRKSKEPSTPRQRPSDAESIQRMLANLPAKRAARQIFPNLTKNPNNKNKILLPNRTKILLKQKMTKTNARGFKVVSTSSTTINSVGTNLALRKRRSVETANAVVRRTRSSLNATAPIAKSKKSTDSSTSEQKSTAESVAATSSTASSSSTSSAASSSTGKSTNEPNNKKTNDLGRVIRRRTKAVVTKITNTFRRGQKQRLLRTTTHHSPNTSKNTNSTKLDTNQLKTKPSKKTFLRTLSSFRRSNRNMKKKDSQQPAKSTENESNPSSLSSSTSKTASNPLTSDEVEKKTPKSRCDSEKSDKDTHETTPMCNANKNENSPTNPIESTNPNPEIVENSTESVQENEEVSKTPETPRLKRKRSIKTIINEMRAKCQNQTAELSQTPNAYDLTSVDDKVKHDDTHQQQSQVIPLVEIEPIDPIPEKVESHISMINTPTHVTMPLSLTIQPLDEPLNLCISPQKNLSAANSSMRDAGGIVSASILQPPESHLENISPRRRTPRKLNDCIAMLTGKLQEKLGVPFIDQTSALLPILSPGSEQKKASIEDKIGKTTIVENYNKKETENPISESTTKTDPIVKDCIEKETIESADAGKSSEVNNRVMELKSNKTENDEISAIEMGLVKTTTAAATAAPKEVENVSKDLGNQDTVQSVKKLRPRKTKDATHILPKEVENSEVVLQTNKIEAVVSVVTAVEEKNEREKNSLQNVESIDTACNSTNELKERTVRKPTEGCLKESEPDNNKQNHAEDTADSIQKVSHQITTNNLDSSENIQRTTQTSQSKSKKMTGKQNTKSDNLLIETPPPNFIPPNDVSVEELPKRSEIKPIEMDVIDIEDEIKLNIVHKEIPAAVKQIIKEISVKQTVSTERKIRNERSKVKGKTKTEQKPKAKAAAAKVPEEMTPEPTTVDTVTLDATPTISLVSTQPEEEKTAENVLEVPTASRTMRSRRQTIVEPPITELQSPDKKKPVKITKSKENKVTKNAMPEKEEESLEREAVKEELLKEVTAKDEPMNEKPSKKTPAKEKSPKAVPIKEMPAREARKARTAAVKITSCPSQINVAVDVILSKENTKIEEPADKKSMEKVPEIELPAELKSIEESPAKQEEVAVEESTSKRKASTKSMKSSPKRATVTKSKSKSKSTPSKKAGKEVNKDEIQTKVAVNPEPSETRHSEPTEQIDNKTNEIVSPLVESTKASTENLSTNQKQSDKTMSVESKTGKQKSKKMKSGEKSVKKVKSNKLSEDTIHFDNSDEELLPWDPEKGFIQAVATTAVDIIKETNETATVEASSSTIAATPIDVPPSETRKIENETIKSAPKPKKKRMSELAQIIADQLLESFKEVDQSRVDELKKIQDLSHPQSEAELISTSLSTTPIPKRKSKKLFENIEPKTSTKTDKVSTKQKSDIRKKAVEHTDETVTSPLNSESIDNKNQEDVTKTENIDETAVSAVIKSKKEKKSAKKKSSKKEAKKKKNNKDTATANETTSIIDSKSEENLLKSPKTDDITEKSSVAMSISNTKTDLNVDKMFEKSLLTKSTAASTAQRAEKVANLQTPTAISDTASLDCNEKSKTSSIFTEVLLSQKNPRTERLSDIIGLADKEALSRVPSIKNVVFPQWQSSIDKPTILTAEKEKTPSLQKETKLNFWSRSSPSSATSEKSDRSKPFGVVKNKARNLFSKISKKMLKKSIKTSIRSSSSSSSSSSCSSVSSSNAPKKPLLRPSILSCNSFRDTVTVKNAAEAPSLNAATMDDIFESLRDSKTHDSAIKTPPKRNVNVSPSKLDTRRSNKKEKNKNPIDTNPKSPIESDMNIAKIAIALEKSQNRKGSQQNKTSMAVDKNVGPSEKLLKKPVITETEKLGTTTIPTTIESSATSSSLFLPALQNEDSQDTIISQIVSKIREKADKNDSDDELCLTDVTKGLPKSTDNELPLTSSTKLAISNDQMNSNIENETSALASNVCKNPESSDAKDINGVENTTKDANYNAASDDENTNTEMIDMDLEDNESVYTTFSQSTSITSGGGGSGGRKKRRKKSILSSGRKSSRRNKERLFTSPNVSYHCDICNKSFRNQHGLNNHKATIMHISKLSEQEFLNAKEKQNENKSAEESNKGEQAKVLAASKEEKIVAIEKSATVESSVVPVKIVVPPETHDNIQSSVIRSSPIKINSTNCSPYVSPNHIINSSGIEPISSPEQSSRFNGTPKTANSLTPSSINARLTLSQEERLFYECCSMLKGSDRPTVGLTMPELITKPVTPKCNEQPANIAQAAQSPRSHSSPRPGLPEIDTNQFSDISSDSNPAYSCPQVPSSSKTQKVFSLERTTPTKKLVGGREKDASRIYSARQTHDNPDASNSEKLANRCSSGSSYPHDSTIVRDYPDSYSDMGDSFPSSQDASESENYAQTILERTNHFPEASSKMTHNTPQKGEGSQYMQASLPHENLDSRSVPNRSHLDSPLHSTSSQSSSLSRPRTKAALKGYENLKVSIPTSGLDMQHALERSPNSNGCKLAALADIALGNDVPFDLIEPHSSATANEKPSPRSTKSPQKTIKSPLQTKSPAKSPSKQSTLFMVSSDSTKLHSIELKSKSFEATFHVSPKSRKRPQSIGKKTGYKDRKKKSRTAGKSNSMKSSPKITNTTKPKDVYDFEESHDSVEDEIIPLTHTRPTKVELNTPTESKTNETPKKQTCDDQEDESSYSDRDDYYNFNSVSGSGTEDQDVPAEDDETSDRETTQSSKSTKQGNDSQKKCLIMGRIFKNAKKNSQTASVENKSSSNNSTREKTAAKPIPKNELDEIFDNLKNKNSDVEKQQQRKRESPRPKPIEEHSKTSKSKIERVDEPKSKPTANDEQSEAIRQKSRKPREVANLEAEWGMSVEQIKGIIGVGMRKAQRRCTANRQNKLVETWSSDEYEEFHSTKDIIALIQEAEMKAQRAKARSEKLQNDAKNAAAAAAAAAASRASTSGGGGDENIDDKSENAETVAKTSKTASDAKKDKPKDRDGHRKVKIDPIESEGIGDDGISAGTVMNAVKPKAKKTTSEKFQSEDESDFDEHWNKKAKRAKIRNRRRTITSREDLIEKKGKSKSKEKLTRKPEVLSKQKHPLQSSSAVGEKKKQHSVKEVESATSAAKSSKSMKDGKPMPRRKRMASEMLYYWSSSSDEEFGRIEADSENDDEDNSENHLEQHGWIVGDSHKKLVTLLAHAKGKKIEDCGVKESVHKRK